MRKIVFAIWLWGACFQASAQAPAVQWQKLYGGSYDDGAKRIQQTTDGGYIVAGYSMSTDGYVTGNHGSADFWIVKLKSSGKILWQKSLGGSGFDVATAIQQTTDGGYIVAGYTYSHDGDVAGNHGSEDCWLVKLSSAGNIEWQKCYGGSVQDEANAIQQTADGGYLIAGNTDSDDGDVTGNHGSTDYWIVKITAAGSIEWQKTLGGTGYEIARSAQQTTDGGYIVAGETESTNGDVTGEHGDQDYWVVKLSATGSMQWQRTYGGSSIDDAYSIRQTMDGGFIAAGRSFSIDGNLIGKAVGVDFWIIKLNDTGMIQWQQSLGGNYVDEAYSIDQTTDGGYIVAGYSQSDDLANCFSSGSNYLTMKLSSSGAVQWQKCIGGNLAENPSSVKQTSDGGYIVTGGTKSDELAGYRGGWDYYIVKLEGTVGVDIIDNNNAISIAPNPATNEFKIQGINNATAVLYDVTGRVVNTFHNTNKISVTELPTGLYFIRLFNAGGELIFYDKIIKQ